MMEPDGSFRFNYISRKTIDFYGIPPEIALQDPNTILEMIVEEDLEHVRASINDSAATLQEWRCQYRVQLADERGWMEGVAQPEKDEVGRTIWHGMVMDITKRK